MPSQKITCSALLRFSVVFLTLVLILRASNAQAATLFLSPKSGVFTVGKTFDVDVRVDSGGQGFNSAQATLQFPRDVLNVQSIDSSAVSTIFNFWLEQPTFSNDKGIISFLGGTTDGVVGASVPLLKITFVAKGSGDAQVAASDAAITASDGSGTNILSNVSGAFFSVKPAVEVLAAPSSSPAAAPASISTAQTTTTLLAKPSELPLVAPVQIKRKAVVVKNLPEKPKIAVAIYPDPAHWYNLTTNYLAQWQLPPDITEVSTAVNQEAVFNPTLSEGLIEAKTFPAVKEGIWYLHVRFKNNVGWGPTADYRIAIDTIPPLSFTTESSAGFTTDNPAPTLTFKTNDALSGLQQYLIRIDGGDTIAQREDSYIPPLLPPGKHIVTIRAMDNAGNIRENNVDLKILSREQPLFVIGGLKISKSLFIVMLVIAMIGAFAAGSFFYRARQKQTTRKVVIAERDVMNLFTLVEKDVDKMLAYYSDNNIDEREAMEMLTILKKIKDNLQKTQKYILENIKEIGD
ncbi:MAG: hypothetical protein HY983_01030 [Candidatus Magasanikbacteria bacterium]|nr:hypothetical protein [Candidatus Magasanikbacteria bacterium]